MSTFSILFKGHSEEGSFELNADFSEWYYSLTEWQQEYTQKSIEDCGVGDTLFLAGHKMYLVAFEDDLPVFSPMRH